MHRLGVCANMLMSEYAKHQYKDNYKMIRIRQHKNYYSSGYVVVTLTEQEMKKLPIYVRKCRPQTKQLVQTVFASWCGKNMLSGSDCIQCGRK